MPQKHNPFRNENWLIPLEEEDYERLKPGDKIQVVYNNTWNDLMPVNYSPDYSILIVVAFFWLLVVLFSRRLVKKDK